MTHSTQVVEAKLRELHNMTLAEIASEILTLEIALDECGAKLTDALEREMTA